METLENFLTAFDADYWQVKAIHHDKTRVAFNQVLATDEISKHVSNLHRLNAQGFNIFARPKGNQYILLDDLRREVLAELATVKPCLLMETSPANFQAWLILPTVPKDDNHTLQVCRWLAQKFQADMASAKPHQIGRLAGFFNVKPKYNQNGVFPMVKLHKFQRRYAQIEIPETLADSPPVVYQKKAGTKQEGADRSGYDFQFACLLVQQGKPDWKILEILKKKSRKAQERRDPDRYLTQTIAAARRKTGIY
ncbi:MAG: DNA-primase RepB domain-containing protein [Cytophagales bacterium]|nr:RepB family DNA primase [Bernardetiaceae bacterium]MDW8204661.1 DNA-primase RepB domain-containing protein [Cytophagales bacterium]